MKSLSNLTVGTAPHKLLLGCTLLALTAIAAQAQQVTGTPGSPSATTTIPGNQLPGVSAVNRAGCLRERPAFHHQSR